MILQKKSLEKLRDLINEDTKSRSGPELVKFFNDLGFNDSYGPKPPSRKVYTDEKLTQINNTSQLDECIKKLFEPVNFIGRYPELDNFIKEFNEFLAFDKLKVIRNEAEITFLETEKIIIDDHSSEIKEDEFLNKQFSEISLKKIGLDDTITKILEYRFEEIKKCLSVNAPLAVIFLSGSVLEGILLGIASKHLKEFNQSQSSPKDEGGKAKQFKDWTLSNYIDVAFDLKILSEDVKKHGHSLRDFRNYIHPNVQVSSSFNPDKHTADICWHVLRAAISQLSENKLATATVSTT